MYPVRFVSNDTICSTNDKQVVLSVTTETDLFHFGFCGDEATAEQKRVFILFQHSYCSDITPILIR
jgi:hypothetical protein